MDGKSMKKWRYLYPVCGLVFPRGGEKKKKTGRKIKPGKSQRFVCLGQLIQPRIQRFHLLPNQDARSFQFCFLIEERGGEGRKRHQSKEAFRVRANYIGQKNERIFDNERQFYVEQVGSIWVKTQKQTDVERQVKSSMVERFISCSFSN